MGMRRAEIAARFDEIVEFAGIERFIDTPVKRYSSGMNARLGFSIAAHLHPDVLLIDEVLAVGDMAFQEKCQARMKRFRDEGVAIVFVSHHLPAVAQLCNQGAAARRGRGGPAGLAGRRSSPTTAAATGCSDGDDVAIEATLASATVGQRRDSPFEVAPGDRLHLDVTLEFRVDVEQRHDRRRRLGPRRASCTSTARAPISSACRRFGRGRRRPDVQLHVRREPHARPLRHRGQRRRSRPASVPRHRARDPHFQVVEHVSYDGIANLYLTGREGDAVRELSRLLPPRSPLHRLTVVPVVDLRTNRSNRLVLHGAVDQLVREQPGMRRASKVDRDRPGSGLNFAPNSASSRNVSSQWKKISDKRHAANGEDEYVDYPDRIRSSWRDRPRHRGRIDGVREREGASEPTRGGTAGARLERRTLRGAAWLRDLHAGGHVAFASGRSPFRGSRSGAAYGDIFFAGGASISLVRKRRLVGRPAIGAAKGPLRGTPWGHPRQVGIRGRQTRLAARMPAGFTPGGLTRPYPIRRAEPQWGSGEHPGRAA